MRRAAVAGMVIALGAFAAMLAAGASAPDPNAVPTAAEVSERTMSPFCPGLTLSECPSPQSAELRSLIAAKVRAGSTNREIDRWLVSSYGEQALGRPRGILPYALPIALAMAGAIAVTVLLFRWTRSNKSAGSQTGPADELTDNERAQMELEIRKFAEGTE